MDLPVAILLCGLGIALLLVWLLPYLFNYRLSRQLQGPALRVEQAYLAARHAKEATVDGVGKTTNYTVTLAAPSLTLKVSRLVYDSVQPGDSVQLVIFGKKAKIYDCYPEKLYQITE